jgi:hypothetical protein
MKLPQLRVMAVSAASLAIITGMATSAASASAATTSSRSAAVTQAAKPAAAQGTVSAPVTGTFTNAAGQGTFTGAFTPKSFHVVNGALQATGLLTGTMTDANGSQLGTVSKTVTETVQTPAASTAAATSAAAPAAVSCSILNLVLGPLNLNLLGLQVNLNQVILVITAIPGAGALLGNLLCAVTNLLNGAGTLTQIAALLNQILGLL